jgi:HSP20 family molecular chaperone IbpA
MHSCNTTTLPQRLPRNIKHITLKPSTNQTHKMAFFPRNFYNNTTNDTSFTPLFRLLDDFDTYSRQGDCGSQGRRSGLTHWQPKFDVRETGEAYELHGELPGVSKDNVQIEFTEPQTMLVRGKAERTYTAGTPPTAAIEAKSTPAASVTEDGERSRKNSTHSHKATVEDEAESQSHESGFEEIVAAKKPEEQQQQQPKKPADKAKYWLTERSIGEFSRSFNFPSRVDQDTVSATFKDGILTVVVPKAKKHEARRIAVN